MFSKHSNDEVKNHIEEVKNTIDETVIKIDDDNKCLKCGKILSSKNYLKKHSIICKGVLNPLECHKCHKILASSSSKCKHLKICKAIVNNKKENEITINFNKMTEYIYLLYEREFIKTKEPIYKIGKSKQENLKRIINYPNGTILLYQICCLNCDIIERELIKIFKNKYKYEKDIGYEYFSGNYKNMINDIHNYITNNENDEIECKDQANDDDYCDYNIDTFQKYNKITNNKIKKIIITNKNTLEGYLLLDNSDLWLIIDKYNANKETDYINKLLKLYSIENNLFKYDYDLIVKDICKLHFNKTPEILILNYNMYLTSYGYIINSKTQELTNINQYNDKLLFNKNVVDLPYINNFDNIDISFVDSYIKFILDNNVNIYKDYKQLCYNVIVEQKYDIKIKSYSNSFIFLFRWLYYLLKRLNPSYTIYTNIDKLPTKYDNNIRLILLHYPNNYKVGNAKLKLEKIGFKNIIVIDDDMPLTKPLERFNFIKDYIKDYIDNSHNIVDTIFEQPDLLLLNYFKWCCSL
jgi:hypothetical protein